MYTHPVPKGAPFETPGSTSQAEYKDTDYTAKAAHYGNTHHLEI